MLRRRRSLFLVVLIAIFILDNGLTKGTTISIKTNSNNKMYLCLNNCALCVRQWETGLYNGEKCAKKCLRFKNNPRIIDPDCNSLKFFNYKFIKSKNKRQHSVHSIVS
jgi:hypothetical protein